MFSCQCWSLLGLASSWPGDCPTEVVEPTLRFITYHPESGSPEAALDHGRLEHRDWPVTRNWDHPSAQEADDDSSRPLHLPTGASHPRFRILLVYFSHPSPSTTALDESAAICPFGTASLGQENGTDERRWYKLVLTSTSTTLQLCLLSNHPDRTRVCTSTLNDSCVRPASDDLAEKAFQLVSNSSS